MQVDMIPMAVVYPPNRQPARAIVSAKVAALAASIREIGLRHPISVRASQRYAMGTLVDAWEIVAGLHRYEAIKSLGHETIPAVVLTLDDLRMELVTIDENLARANLSPAEDASWTTRRKEIYEALHPDTKAGVAGAQAKHRRANDNLSFAENTAKSTGKTKRTVERAAKRGKALGPETLEKITGTSLDKGSELDALAKMPDKDREQLVERAVAGEKISARAAPPAETEPSVEDDVDPENYRTAYLIRADQAIRFASYSGPISTEIIAAAHAVASAWTRLARELEGVDRAAAGEKVSAGASATEGTSLSRRQLGYILHFMEKLCLDAAQLVTRPPRGCEPNPGAAEEVLRLKLEIARRGLQFAGPPVDLPSDYDALVRLSDSINSLSSIDDDTLFGLGLFQFVRPKARQRKVEQSPPIVPTADPIEGDGLSIPAFLIRQS